MMMDKQKHLLKKKEKDSQDFAVYLFKVVGRYGYMFKNI